VQLILARSPHNYRILLNFLMFTYSVAALVASNRGLTVWCSCFKNRTVSVNNSTNK
jgi:hypothetical protein